MPVAVPPLRKWLPEFSAVCHRCSRKILCLSWVKLRRLPFPGVPVDVQLVPSGCSFSLGYFLSPSSWGLILHMPRFIASRRLIGKFETLSVYRFPFLILSIANCRHTIISKCRLLLFIAAWFFLTLSEDTSRHRPGAPWALSHLPSFLLKTTCCIIHIPPFKNRYFVYCVWPAFFYELFWYSLFHPGWHSWLLYLQIFHLVSQCILQRVFWDEGRWHPPLETHDGFVPFS